MWRDISGGLKTWECAYDLVAYLVRNYPATAWAGMRVLEVPPA